MAGLLVTSYAADPSVDAAQPEIVRLLQDLSKLPPDAPVRKEPSVEKALRLSEGIKNLRTTGRSEEAQRIAEANRRVLEEACRMMELARRIDAQLDEVAAFGAELPDALPQEAVRTWEKTIGTVQEAVDNGRIAAAGQMMNQALSSLQAMMDNYCATLTAEIKENEELLDLFSERSAAFLLEPIVKSADTNTAGRIKQLAAGRKQYRQEMEKTVLQRTQLLQAIDSAASVSQALAILAPLEKHRPDAPFLRRLHKQILANRRFHFGDSTQSTIGMKLTYLPPGNFIMGSPQLETGHQSGETQHPVEISCGFFIGVCEVTRAQWQAVMNPGAAEAPESASFPQNNINWYQAQAFCERLSALEHPRRYRLPTEAEWEYACRAGSQYPFHTGSTLAVPGQAVLFSLQAPPQGPGNTGSCAPNLWGLYDMHGNLSEWCSDWLAPYSEAPQTDPTGPTDREVDPDVGRKIVRGGSWMDDQATARAACRQSELPIIGSDTLGFRVVLEADSLN